VLHNNVGIARAGGPEDLSSAEWDSVFEVNAKSMFLTCKHVLPHMVAQRGGALVNVSTISSTRVSRGLSYVAYPTSKAAVNQLTKVIAATYGRHGVRCNAILPGFVLTPMVERSVLGAAAGPDGAPLGLKDYLAKRTANIPLGAWADAWDIARAALFLASEDVRSHHGYRARGRRRSDVAVRLNLSTARRRARGSCAGLIK
jgi:NAD(P)-dependent dehydrogenase (short-subunit alcohol dehydrogenase family)